MSKHYCGRLILLFCISSSSLFCTKSISQTIKNIQLLKQKFSNADSAILITHELTAEYAIKVVPDWDSRDTSMNLQKWKTLHPTPPPFLIKGKLNRQIIGEAASLDDSSRKKLSVILLRPVNLNYWAPNKCDMPQHSIIFYAGNRQSFIDICFGCKRIHSSNDVPFNEMNMDEKKWFELMAFFKTNGLTKIFKDYEQTGTE